jgi:hypothetical protein
VHNAMDWSSRASVQPDRFKEEINASAQMKDCVVMTAVSFVKRGCSTISLYLHIIL